MIFVILFCLLFIPVIADAGYLPEGVLVKASEEEKVYFVDDGKKRWIDSGATFNFHGFSWDKILEISSSALADVASGETLTNKENVILPGEEAYLPDLTPFPASDLRLATRKGRTILKFTSTFFNKGRGQLELTGKMKSAGADGDIDQDVYQRVQNSGGRYRDKLVGSFSWHGAHEHYHFRDFGEFALSPVGEKERVLNVLEKTTRCLWDTKPVALELEGAPAKKVFHTCKDKSRQGISVGWGDVYDYTLADQYLDVHDLPSGIYTLTLTIDSNNLFVEGQEDNNQSVVLVELDAKNKRVKTIASAAPFYRANASSYPNGMLVRGDADEKMYVIHNNKKRHLKNDTIFASYGYREEDVREFPQSIVDAIPFQNLVRVGGVNVYALNDSGFKRHIRNPDIFASYNLSWDDVADISDEEFSRYPDAPFVRVAGLPEVYYQIEGDALRPIEADQTFNFDRVQIINKTDFESYVILDV